MGGPVRGMSSAPPFTVPIMRSSGKNLQHRQAVPIGFSDEFERHCRQYCCLKGKRARSGPQLRDHLTSVPLSLEGVRDFDPAMSAGNSETIWLRPARSRFTPNCGLAKCDAGTALSAE